MEHTEDPEEYTEEVIEAPINKLKKKMTYTPEQLEKKRDSMKKAREFRNISYKEENKTLKKKLEEKEQEPEPVEEYEPEPVVIRKTAVSVARTIQPTPAPVKSSGRTESAKPKSMPKQRIIYQEEEEEPEYEEVIVRRIKRTESSKPTSSYVERPDLIDETYKEQLQKKLQDARRQQVMADLFDF